MFTLAQLKSKTTVETSKNTITQSVTKYIASLVNEAKTKSLSRDEVETAVINYTLKNQRNNWFDTSTKYATFMSDFSNAQNEAKTSTKLVDKLLSNKTNLAFIDAMQKKVVDLFYSTTHKRSIGNVNSNDKATNKLQAIIKVVDGNIVLS